MTIRPGQTSCPKCDLAAMAGIARENVTRVINDWQRHKVLSRLSGYYCIENKARLESQVRLKHTRLPVWLLGPR
jgi:hypothetical protein